MKRFEIKYRNRIWVWATLVVALTTALASMPRPVLAVTLQEEIELGKKIDAEVLKENPLSSDQSAQDEITRLGQIIVQKGGIRRPEIQYHFKVISGDDLNAFAVPGGYIYFTERLWNVLRTDERAGVLAHEIVHADRRHGLDAVLKLQKRSTILGAILIITGANQTIGDVVGVANQLYTLKYSRADERQADEIGTDLLKASNLNPAGLLMAMRKIGRFQSESGGRMPTILSSHPDTQERVRYLSEHLTKLGVPVPPEAITTRTSEGRIGAVVSRSGDTVVFSSSQPLKEGDAVWLMSKGWDYYFEHQVSVPSARVVVTAVKGNYTGRLYTIDAQKARAIARGSEVYMPPAPSPVAGVAVIKNSSLMASEGYTPKKLDRLLAKDTVWDPKAEQLVQDSTAYVVLTEPANRNGYVSVQRARYSYAPLGSGSTLVRLDDPDEARWVGIVVSVGRSSKQVEVLASKPLAISKVYEIAQPAWDKSGYGTRVIATAKFTQSSGKVVMNVVNYTPGFSIADINNGYDIYEQAPSSK